MGKLRKIGYDLKDVSIVQAAISYIEHRNEINPFVEICGRKSYPVFVSPMAAVTNQTNYKVWIENKLGCVIPRSVQKSEYNLDGISFEERMELAKETFVSFSLSEANEIIEYFEKYVSAETGDTYYICIDIAQGTMNKLYKTCRLIKEKWGDKVVIMTGNVATPDAYKYFADAGIDYMRVMVGSGSRCTTASNGGIYYPGATLLDDLSENRKKYAHEHNMVTSPTKLVYDGGISNFDDIQKALALGADAVMCGNIFARTEEACGEVFWAEDEEKIKQGIIYFEGELSDDDKSRMHKYRNYYGMSTKHAQKLTGGNGKTTAEGISRPVPVEEPVAKWVDNMQSYLRSCMSYTNSRTIEDFRNNAQVIIDGGGDGNFRK